MYCTAWMNVLPRTVLDSIQFTILCDTKKFASYNSPATIHDVD